MNKNWIKAIGLLATVVGFGASFVTDYVNDKKMEEKISNGINEALAKKLNNAKES